MAAQGRLVSTTFDNEEAVALARQRRSSARVVDRSIVRAEDVSSVRSQWGSVILRAVSFVRTAARTSGTGQARSISIPVPQGLSFDAFADLATRLLEVLGDRSMYLTHAGRTVTLNAQNKTAFLNEMRGTIGQRASGFEGGSNVEVIGDLLSSVGGDRVLKITIPGTTAQSGGFFPHLLCFPELFSAAVRTGLEQIGLFCGPHCDPSNYQHTCLTIAISKEVFPSLPWREACDRFTETHSSSFLYIVQHTRNGAFDRDRLGRLATQLRRHLRLTCIVGSRRVTKEYKCESSEEELPSINLGLLCSHFFSMAPIESVSVFALRHLDSIIGSSFCTNTISRFVAKGDTFGVVDHRWQQVTQRECGVDGTIRWKRRADVRCCPFTFLETLLLQYSESLLLPINALAFYEAIAIAQNCKSTREAVWMRAMIVDPNEYAPVGNSLKDLRHEEKVTKTYIAHSSLKSREEAAAFMQRAKEKRTRRTDLGFEQPKQREETVYGFFDVESRGDAQLPYCCALTFAEPGDDTRDELDYKGGERFIGDKCGEDMLRHVRYKYSAETRVVLFAHNSNYDIRVLIFRLSLPIAYEESGCIFRGNSSTIISLSIVYEGMKICFRDTYAHFGAPLRSLPASFEVRTRKEVMSHEVVNAASDAGIISVEQASRILKSVMGPEDFDLFWENAKTWNACFQENGETYLDIFKYSSIYW